MQLTRLSSKGQVIIPKSIRDAHKWQVGQELVVFDVEEGLLLTAKKTFDETSLDKVAGCLARKGKTKSLQDLKTGLRDGLRELKTFDKGFIERSQGLSDCIVKPL